MYNFIQGTWHEIFLNWSGMIFSAPRKTVLVTGLVYLAIFLNFFLVGTIVPLLPRLADQHGISSIEASLVLSIKSFTHMAVSPILAIMASRWSPKDLFCFGQFAIAGAYFGCAFSSSFAGFLVSRIAQGMGIASVMVSGMSLLVEAAPKEQRGRYISFAYAGLAHSSLIAPVLSALMYDHLGQTWTFLIPGIAILASGTAALIYLNRYMHQKPNPSDPQSQESSMQYLDRKLIIPIVKTIFCLSLAYLTYVGIFSCGFAYGCVETSIPQYMTDRGETVLTSNLLWSSGALTFAVFAPIIGWLIDKFGPPIFVISAMISYVIVGPLVHLIATSKGGIAASIIILTVVQATAEIAIYPLATLVVEAACVVLKTPPDSVHIVGFCLVEMFVQGGFAVGNIVGKVFYDWDGLYGVGIGISSVPAGTIILITLIHYTVFQKRN